MSLPFSLFLIPHMQLIIYHRIAEGYTPITYAFVRKRSIISADINMSSKTSCPAGVTSNLVYSISLPGLRMWLLGMNFAKRFVLVLSLDLKH